MSTIFKTDKLYKKVTNKKLIEKMAYYITQNMDIEEVKRYRKNFPIELDYNIYQYGNLDVYDCDLYTTLYNMGLRTKAVTDYHNNLDTMPFPYKYREAIRNTYKYLVRLAVDKIITDSLKV